VVFYFRTREPAGTDVPREMARNASGGSPGSHIKTWTQEKKSSVLKKGQKNARSDVRREPGKKHEEIGLRNRPGGENFMIPSTERTTGGGVLAMSQERAAGGNEKKKKQLKAKFDG